MRQGQQNRRGRGRHGGGGSHGGNFSNHNNNNNNNNNRKGQNPLARSYESNGPDVKIRGNPAHIAEKYMTLARDAQSSGDSVLAESYLQHAEHYNRIIMAYREQQQQTGEGQQFRQRPQGEQSEGGGGDMGPDDGDDDNPMSVDAQIRGQEPQPGMFDMPQSRFGDRQADQPRDDRGNRDDRGQRNFDDRQQRRHDGNRDRDGNRDGGRRERYGENRGYNGNRDDRRERFDRFQGQDRGERAVGPQDRPPEQRQQERPDRVVPERAIEPRIPVEQPVVTAPMEVEAAAPAREPRETPAPRRRAAPAADRFADSQQEQAPEFLRRPVRRPRREAAATTEVADAPAADDTGSKTSE